MSTAPASRPCPRPGSARPSPLKAPTAPGEEVRAAHGRPATISRSLLMKRRPTNFHPPEARVMGAEPAYAFRARTSVKRSRSSLNLGEHPGAEPDAEAGGAEQRVSVRACAFEPYGPPRLIPLTTRFGG